ncbi:MAG: ATP-binding protein, partial [Oscillospiraceae bacterium]|nr:ATP-binding protein [Oscillospiraceae bacterium]
MEDLKSKYMSIIEDPIIDAKEIKPDTEDISLRFPKIIDAFIPQSYKCFSYKQKGIKLEDSSIWDELPVNNDLNSFFIRYLYSPDSIDYPLVILGHPGSGKSLLTKVLSAQLMSDSYTVIRIPLREVNADHGIDILVEDQIKKLTNRSLTTQGYGGFAEQFSEKPLIIILDGYDELLQAKGDVFSSYLEKARTFQKDQRGMKRPVRIIITSRITLIDKARIPENSTILRLMEFDEKQRQAWIDIWNEVNADYFHNSNIEPFKLPIGEPGKKNNVLELAEQPLLLLMLALYDAEANDLARISNIGRTELYDSLLRRFVRRERGRYSPGFSDKTPIEQEKIIDQEMNRLGVIAIGMYNRRDVVIRSEQLGNDLESFQAHRNDGSPKAKTLTEAESVLGGFFFIHKSIAQDIAANSNNSENAYEFLHNTFGEFLAADFILRNTINEVKSVYVDRKFKPTTELENPDRYDPAWFYCLMFVPLYSRPVIVEMLHEHAMKAFQHSLGTDASKIE